VNHRISPVAIVMAEDDPEDRELAGHAWRESRLANPVDYVGDGEELIEYLKHTGRHAQRGPSPHPALILLDLKMPRMDGFEALRTIREDPELRHIPVVVLTTSSADEDVLRSYSLGVNSFITKPVTFEGLVQAMKMMGRYWFELVELPPPQHGGIGQGVAR
jgi:CheY-like chemotaxis protein